MVQAEHLRQQSTVTADTQREDVAQKQCERKIQPEHSLKHCSLKKRTLKHSFCSFPTSNLGACQQTRFRNRLSAWHEFASEAMTLVSSTTTTLLPHFPTASNHKQTMRSPPEPLTPSPKCPNPASKQPTPPSSPGNV